MSGTTRALVNTPVDDDGSAAVTTEGSGDVTSTAALLITTAPSGPHRTPIVSNSDLFSFETGSPKNSPTTTSEAVSITASAPLLAVVSIVAFITIVLLFVGMVRYWFCKRASYKIKESYELQNMEDDSKPLNAQESTGIETVYSGDVKKEWLV